MRLHRFRENNISMITLCDSFSCPQGNDMHKTALFDRMMARFHDVVIGRMDVSITVRMETHSRRRSSLWA